MFIKIIIGIIIGEVIYLLYKKLTSRKSDIDNCMRCYSEEIKERMKCENYQNRIISNDQLAPYLKKTFYLSIEQEIDCFFFMLGINDKINKTEDLVFYNSRTHFYPSFDQSNEGTIQILKKRNDFSFPCSTDGSLILESPRYYHYGGNRIELGKVEDRIKKIVVAISDIDYNSRPIDAFTLRLSKNMIDYDKDDCGLEDSFYFEDILVKTPAVVLSICEFERNEKNEWQFHRLSDNYDSLQDILVKYAPDFIDQ